MDPRVQKSLDALLLSAEMVDILEFILQGTLLVGI